MGRTLPGTPQMGSLTRNSSRRSLRSRAAGPQVPTNSIGPSTAVNTLSSLGSHMTHVLTGTLTSHGHTTLSSVGSHHAHTHSTLSGPMSHSGNNTLSSLGSHSLHVSHGPSSISHQQPDILKSTPDHSPGGLHRTDSKKRHQLDGGLTWCMMPASIPGKETECWTWDWCWCYQTNYGNVTEVKYLRCHWLWKLVRIVLWFLFNSCDLVGVHLQREIHF